MTGNSHQHFLIQIVSQQKISDSFAHVDLLLLLLSEALLQSSIRNVQFLADITKTLHLHCCLLSLAIQAANSGRFHHGDAFNGQLVAEDQSRHQHSSIGGQLHCTQVPNIHKMLPQRSRTIPWRMITQNSSKDDIVPFFSRRELFFATHVQHAHFSFQLSCHFLQALPLQLILIFILCKTLLKLTKESFVVIFMLALVVIDDLCVGDDETCRRATEVLLHGLIL